MAESMLTSGKLESSPGEAVLQVDEDRRLNKKVNSPRLRISGSRRNAAPLPASIAHSLARFWRLTTAASNLQQLTLVVCSGFATESAT